MVSIYSTEALMLCSINDRFDNELLDVKIMREMYVKIADLLIKSRDTVGRGEAGRNYSIAITELENSCMRAIKGPFSINGWSNIGLITLVWRYYCENLSD
ncbi:MAG: hypothetical protein ACTSQA_03435 [Candidatus Heimdallarchaeaceae archaeon]